MDYAEMLLWVMSIILSFVLGWLTNWYFYRKQRNEGKSAMKILEQLQQYNDTLIRLGNDKRGRIIRNKDGTYAIAWSVELKESISVGA
jgi:type II secretory pathway pseudopilin PulG